MITPDSNKSWIVFLSTFPPRKCGIATFTEDLATSFDVLFAPRTQSKIVAMADEPDHPYAYDDRVILEIDQSDLKSYQKAAEELNNLPQVKLVNVQHEFGIFGGAQGENLLVFLRHLTKPVVITLHTVLPAPNPEYKRMVEQLSRYAKVLVVMTNLSYKILKNDYDLGQVAIKVIPHGLHSAELSDPDDHKAAMGLEGRTVLATFGLISRSKGLEYVLDALPQVVKQYPEVIYAVIGATHPKVLEYEGESYREFLTSKIKELGLENNVKFYNQYFETPELLELLKPIDIYMATSTNPDQAVSGTLTYAMGTGRPVISTAFAQAREVVTPTVGRLVPIGSPDAYAAAILEILGNKKLKKTLGRNAYISTRPMTWLNVALAYMQVYSQEVPEFRETRQHFPEVKLDHLKRMTSEFGIYQFAKQTLPDPKSGYTVDDNARALIVACMYGSYSSSGPLQDLARVYLGYIQHTSRDDGYFYNYVNHNRTLNEERIAKESKEDPSARALLGLAVAATTEGLDPMIKQTAQDMFRSSLAKKVKFQNLKAAAFYSKALGIWLQEYDDDSARAALRESSAVLATSYRQQAQEDWAWFSDELNYSNAVLPEAMLWAYLTLQDPELLEIARASLDFLITQTFLGQIYVPIGQNGWYSKGKARALYDQQPEDPCAMVQVLSTMFKVTKEERYKVLMEQVFFWFLGNNLSHQIVYDASSGGCYDGLHEHSVNLNEGAESTLSYLIARLLVSQPG